MKKLLAYITIIVGCFMTVSCEIDNYEAPDVTIQGTIYDHNGQPLQVDHGVSYIRMREISWGDGNNYIGNRSLKIQQNGTYRNTKQFAGEYLMLPYNGNFYPYWDADDPVKDGDEAGELVKISGTTTKDFTVIPYLTIEWVKKPTVTPDNYLECTVRFKRNRKEGFGMPDVKEAYLSVSRTINASASDGNLFPTARVLNNNEEGQDITFRTSRPLKYNGINYWVRVRMNCQTAAGNATTNYPGMGQFNCSTIEQIFVP
ncbi:MULTISPECIES: DUF3823 domain-containing protein [Bacteroides]|uniref:DUF3823 domain-containing protein n=1 Tax=Bacteroides TaxID=816 RepID=UPI00189CA95B|nr:MULTISPECIES: DUF3823 domain-containing protein [Bacteroides]MDC2614576.1 DUF3823 domain-containing protein [Bacteroides ovatus]MDC2633831.1 DUF3823 domain-containing protein [Bacteroides ovatus]